MIDLTGKENSGTGGPAERFSMKIASTVIGVMEGDITKLVGMDAIVHDCDMRGGGLDSIFSAGGPEMTEEYRAKGGGRAAGAVLTGGYGIPCRYVIHTHGPILLEYVDVFDLMECYENALSLAAEHGIRSLAFQPLGTDSGHASPDTRARVGVRAVCRFVAEHPGVFDRILWAASWPSHLWYFEKELRAVSQADTERTREFYDTYAHDYFRRTKDVDMTVLYERFAPLLPAGGFVLDVGCGSGRDMKWFAERGFRVFGIDASQHLSGIAEEYAGHDVKTACCTIEDWTRDGALMEPAYEPHEPGLFQWDGIWANASLLHLEEEELFRFFEAAAERLVPGGGVLFFSMKEEPGDEAEVLWNETNEDARAAGRGLMCRDREGRFFRTFTGGDLAEVMYRMHDRLEIVDSWTTSDRMGRGVSWRNVILRRLPAEPGFHFDPDVFKGVL